MMKRKTFEETVMPFVNNIDNEQEFSLEEIVTEAIALSKKCFHANDEYIDHLEKQNEILMQAIDQINERYDLHVSSIVDEALEKIKGMG